MNMDQGYKSTYEMPDYTVTFTRQPPGYNARFSYNGRFYDVYLQNDKEYESTIKLLSKGKISIEEDPMRPKYAKISRILTYRYNTRSIFHRICLILIGLSLITFCVLMLYGGYLDMSSHHFTGITQDVGLVCFLLGVIYAGISLIRYAFGRIVYCWMNFFGIITTAFGFCELFFVADDIQNEKDTLSRNIGGSIVFFIIIGLGILLIVLSHTKKKKADVILKRTPILPSFEETERLYDHILEKSRALAIILSKGDNPPTYTGSRAGGVPYDDGTKTHPISMTGQELTFIFQINLSELNVDSVLPKSGILEFFINDYVDPGQTEIKTVYYPHINEMLLGDTKYSTAIKMTPQVIAAIDNFGPYNMDYVFNTANEMGIYLNTDAEYFELFGNMPGVQSDICYLLGPAKIMPPRTEAANLGDRRIDQPLLSLDIYGDFIDELLINTPDVDYYNMQVYTSMYNLKNLETAIPEDIITVHSINDTNGDGSSM